MEEKIVYQTDAEGYFVGTALADESPLEQGVWLIPAGAVEKAPPSIPAGKRARWTGAAWKLEVIPGPEPEPPAPPLNDMDVNSERDRRIEAGVTFGGKLYQSKATDRENIAGAAQLAFMAVVGGALPGTKRWHGGASDFAWIAADNTLTTMDAQTVIAFAKTSAEHKSAHIFAARALKDLASIPADFTNDTYWP